jgi:hypothetical protein
MAATEPGQVIGEFTKCFNSGDIEGLASLYEAEPPSLRSWVRCSRMPPDCGARSRAF